MKGIEVITNPEKARVLVDPMRREMARLLAHNEMTENELAESLGLSDPAVGHHLRVLRKSGLVRIARKKIEKHGIVQKFYKTNALVYLVDTRDMPLEIERYFMPRSLERVRGMIAVVNALTDEPEEVPTAEVEKFAKILSSTILKVARKYSTRLDLDREELVSLVYRDAFAHLLRNPHVLPDKVRNLLLRVDKRTSVS